ncbi:MAG: VTT domain-containing protein [bacterium]
MNRDDRTEVASSIFEVGHNCWRREPAGRAAFLVDGEAYFDAVASAIEQARHQVLIIGWDVHSRVHLRRDPDGSGRDALADLLDRCVRRRPELHVHVLAWDFAMIYAMERETLPLLRFGLRTHRRVHFHLDDRHPVGGSHHQKIVVVDDAIAFCGGLDLTAGRWDTPEHRPDDPRRRLPAGTSYGPFHDVQAAVDGAAAAALGDLARWRWERATGTTLESPTGVFDAWPSDVAPSLREVHVGIARTQPAYHDEPEAHEVENLYLDACRAARRTIYIESQYLTAARIGEALAERLREPEGPELVIVTRMGWSGWLEEKTMGLLRARLAERLRAEDVHGRLRIVTPIVPGLGPEGLKLHSKLMIVDDVFVRVGSANLANRSMGLDSECDLAFEAECAAHAASIGDLRRRLLAEHLDCSPEEVREQERETGSLIETLDRLSREPRRLTPLPARVPEWIDGLEDEIDILDPERPVEFERLQEQFLPEEEIARPARLRLALAGLVAGALLALAAAFHLTPLGEWTTVARLTELAGALQQGWTGPLMGLAFFVLLANLLVPVTALVVVSGVVFGWPLGFLIGMTGSVLASAIGYGIGAHLWRDTVRLLTGEYLERLGERLKRNGLFVAMAVRIIPVAPFPVVNLVAGASHISLRDFLLGTAIGMAPGMLLLVLFAENAWTAFQDPKPERIALLIAIVGIFVLSALALRRRVRNPVSEP